MPTISGVMLVLNELPFLEINVPLLVSLLDELIIVDMGSTDGSRDFISATNSIPAKLVDYPRSNLFRFGFAHARNYGAGYARGDWIFSIDADEIILDDALRAAVSSCDHQTNCLLVERKNYKLNPELKLSEPRAIVRSAEYSVEHHKRIYRNVSSLEYRGIVHEELHENGVSPVVNQKYTDLTLHHLSAYRPGNDSNEKHLLYSYLLMKAYHYKSFRAGMNDWYFKEYIPKYFQDINHMAVAFADANGLERYDADPVPLGRAAG